MKENKTDDYKYRIQCCYNCRHWEVDYTLMNEYAYNACSIEYRLNDKGNESNFITTKFDYWCPNYCGNKQEENLVYKEYCGAKVVE